MVKVSIDLGNFFFFNMFICLLGFDEKCIFFFLSGGKTLKQLLRDVVPVLCS